jgi:hypothetical protein
MEEDVTYSIRPMVNLVSTIPVVLARAHSTSVSVGEYPGDPILLASPRKLQCPNQHCRPSVGQMEKRGRRAERKRENGEEIRTIEHYPSKRIHYCGP